MTIKTTYANKSYNLDVTCNVCEHHTSICLQKVAGPWATECDLNLWIEKGFSELVDEDGWAHLSVEITSKKAKFSAKGLYLCPTCKDKNKLANVILDYVRNEITVPRGGWF